MCLCIYMKSCFQNGMEEGDPNCLGKIVYFISHTTQSSKANRLDYAIPVNRKSSEFVFPEETEKSLYFIVAICQG